MQVIDKTTYREFVAEDGKLARLKGSKDAPHSRGMMPNGTTADDFEEITAEQYQAELDEAERAKRYKEAVTAAIRRHYDSDDEAAILANGKDTPAHAAEWEAYQAYRKACKEEAKLILDNPSDV